MSWLGSASVGMRALSPSLVTCVAGWTSLRRLSDWRRQAVKREKPTQRQNCDQKPIASRVHSSIHGATNKTLAGTW
jgi:ABC-type nickel/cobalt efflux system permease component RcnA